MPEDSILGPSAPQAWIDAAYLAADDLHPASMKRSAQVHDDFL